MPFYGGGRYSKPAPPATSYEKQVLALGRACAEFGLTVAEVEAMQPARYNSCHGNSYPVWNKEQLSGARAAANRRKEEALEAQHGGKEALAAHRLREQEAQRKANDSRTADSLRDQLGALQPGCKAPEALPTGVLNKTTAKKLFFLTDNDLNKLQVLDAGALTCAATSKHGPAGFSSRRQAVADKLAAAQRAPLEQQVWLFRVASPRGARIFRVASSHAVWSVSHRLAVCDASVSHRLAVSWGGLSVAHRLTV